MDAGSRGAISAHASARFDHHGFGLQLDPALGAPGLADPWLRFNAKVAEGFVLCAWYREIAISRVAWRRASDYEWIHHTLSAARAGLTKANLDALQNDDADDQWSGLEILLIRATDEIYAEGGIAPQTLAQLVEHFTTQQVIELVFVIGAYIALAAILNTAGAEIEPRIMQQAKAAGFPRLVLI
ncbi:carboxymuconolactone decarboxylase family protein [Novosphingobium aerophilum]|uniref:carboxymuconolactone decarboxylase family protein n=1 Tax=Novosphingobium TaxID=165696 RepID=UPI0006C8DB8F|nr:MULTISPECIES: hypothetical protein [unclassified Novosphingobium]KPH67773.1 hypothetical protein ADT71_01865 [Novosphingobium sp. ST904]TCM23848.1 hypothetical protein EDF59_1506 [Novosphingobium sp. ST904]WRT95886.1 hypothetical protein U9J33_20000 [Novosphingobium sp. RL4]